MTYAAMGLLEGIDRDAVTARLVDLVRAESENPPGNEAKVAGVVAAMCEALGLAVELHEHEPGRPSVVARWSGAPGPTVGFCSHIDVVPAGEREDWAVPPYDGTISEGRLHGRGSSDAKGPIAAALEAVAMLQRNGFEPTGTLEMALVADEEAGGFHGAAALVEEGITRPEVAVIGEPTSLRVVHAQRGIAWSRIITRGVAAHGSAPERGINAILHMAEVIRHLVPTIPDISHPVVGAPTVNVGTIHGGDKVNMIPSLCIAEIDRRTLPGESEADVLGHFDAAIALARQTYPDIDARGEIVSFGTPFEVPADAPLVKTLAGAVEDVTGEPPELIGFRGTSDARFFAEAGAEVLVFGPGDITLAHTARESIDLEQLATGAACYALGFARLLDG
ncbi:MAG: M20 family metallopeptidase [Actinomycetota bacterium]|nr:M20 family metallopeptidase [Actinomycetota bacterium]